MIFNSFGDLISSINDYDKSGPFSIGFKMFLLGFVLVFLAIFGSNMRLNNEYRPLSQESNAKRILVIIGLVVAISGLIISIASVYIWQFTLPLFQGLVFRIYFTGSNFPFVLGFTLLAQTFPFLIILYFRAARLQLQVN